MSRAPLLFVALLAAAAPARGEGPVGPFTLSEWRVPGRAIQAFVVRDETGRDTVLVISLVGSPPHERRYVSWLPRDWTRKASPIEVPPEVPVVDAAELGLAPGPELVLVSARELRIVSATGQTLRSVHLAPPLSLPARTWELSRLAFVRDWNGNGRLEALLPSADGARLQPLEPGASAQTLALPLIADYGSPTLENWFRPGFLTGILSWPTLALGDDDGDGRTDLFAATRYELLVFHGGPRGLPSEPSARRAFPPFTADEERRHTGSTLLAFSRDLDGDGRVDLMLHRMVGSLTQSHSTTTLYRNLGSGADPLGPAWAQVEAKGGTTAVALADLDGDGRFELLEAHIGFGVVQAIRMLTLGRIEARLSARVLPSEDGGTPVETWSADASFPFDFATSRVLGILPYIEADWNGDGLRDACWSTGSGDLQFRLGERRPNGPGFGPVAARLRLPISGDLVAADLDGDGLPDLVAWDPLDLEGRVHIGINRGVLPGTRPGIHAHPAPPAPR